MPIKEFYCTECKTSFEKFYNSIPDYAILKPVCPHCGNMNTRERPSLFNISKTTEKRKGRKVTVAKYVLDSVYEVEV